MQYCEARGAGGGSKMFAHVDERTIISLDGDKLIRMWGLFEGGGEEVFTAAQPKRILVGTDSLPIALFALQGGLLVGAVCASGSVVVWVADSGSISFRGSLAAASSSSSSFEAHVVDFNGQSRIVASQANVEGGLRIMLFEANFDGLRPELKCICRYEPSLAR